MNNLNSILNNHINLNPYDLNKYTNINPLCNISNIDTDFNPFYKLWINKSISIHITRKFSRVRIFWPLYPNYHIRIAI